MSKCVICSSHKILELFGKICQVEGCGKEYHFNNTTIGCCLSISAQCSNGHSRKWLSSEKISNGSSDIYQDNLDFAAALILSGNPFAKVQQLCQFFEMEVLSCTSFYSYQRLYICPAIDKFYEKQQVNPFFVLIQELSQMYLVGSVAVSI